MLGLTAFLPAAEAADSSLLFLAEDVPSGLDPDGPSIAIPTTQLGMVQLLEPLIAYADKASPNEDGVKMPDFSKPVGRLLESWSYDPGTLTWTLKLRHGVKSCAGNEFTADDLLYTYARALNVGGAVPNAWFLLNMASVKGFSTDVFSSDPEVAKKAKTLGDGVRKVDDYTVEVTQTEPNPLFLVNIAVTISQGVFDSKAMKEHATADDPWSYNYANNVNLPSFGPYCLESWTKNSEIRFKANPNYYRGKAPIEHVIIKKVPQGGNRISILRSGQAQLIQGMTPNQYDSIRKMPGLSVSGVYGNEGLFVVMNFKNPPFDNIKLRQAIAYAMPYDRVIQVGYGGQAKKWESVVPSTYPGFVAHEPPYTYDPEKAKQLLAEAGYPGGKGLEKYADQFKLTYVSEKETTLGPVVNQIRSALAAVGLPVTLDPIPQAQYGDRQIVKKDLAFAINDQEKPIGVDTGYAMQLFFVSKAAGGINNMVNYDNPKLDAMWAKARVEPDTAKRDEILAQMQNILMRDVVWLPVVEFKTQWAHSDKLKGFTWNPGNSLLLYDLHY
ncbi:ABC transporter substrate-binding protein [Jiella mangrovi]|uniref:ABC transporter substrate-binding protein n=1 Tax=Jiella mangrovi TaxID=2821407 RepID=A0ABS4BI01_9HYPH|nr:ABC transporter substrate-binding protein [Jiella mangrovi]MBP0615801.1 ABC transporter substrate-binding protein [Jiella mangrovi]